MSTDYHQLYLDNTATLAKTMVIKSQTAIDLINDFIRLQYGSTAVDDFNPKSWKYYMNICGQYHPTDTIMQITSLDTLETIDFTVDNLRINTATAEAYKYGSRYYYALLNRYPNQEQIILGVLYPANIDLAIQAKDGTILSYPTGLVEEQEITLLEELQQWIYRYKIRWDVQAFGISDSLYPVAQHAIFYLQLLPKIFNLRVKRCKTSEAHSFHIRSYLASHLHLDKYYDYMTLEQVLFLYRNINYLERNAGKSNTFNWLVEKILSLRQIPIAEYQLRLEGTFDNHYYPNYQFRRVPLNTEFNNGFKDYFPLANVLSKERYLAHDNEDFIYFNTKDIDNEIKNATSSQYLTKGLESSMTDYTGDQIHPLTEILLNHWAWLSVNSLYRVAVVFKDPVTGSEQILFSDDAFIYYVYIFMMSIGAPITKIPKFDVLRVQPLKKPLVKDLMAVVDTKIIQNDSIAIELIQKQPDIRRCYSVSGFFNLCQSIFDAEDYHWRLTANTGHMYERALIENMINRLYCDAEIHFPNEGADYSTWLKDRSLPTEKYEPSACQELLSNIFSAATGYSIDPTNVIGNIQKAMLSIMTDLSSYSVQYIQEINSEPIEPLGWPGFRVGDTKGISSTKVFVDDTIEIIDTLIQEKMTLPLETFSERTITVKENKLNQSVKLFEKLIDIQFKNLPSDQINILFKHMFIKATYAGYDHNVSINKPFIGFENYAALTDLQKLKIVDIYDSPVFSPIDLTTMQQPLEDAIIFNSLNSVKYIPISNPEIPS